MITFNRSPYGPTLVAAARVTVVEGSAVFTANTDVYGFSAVTLNGAIVELTLGSNSHVAPADGGIMASVVSATGILIDASQVTENQINVSLLTTGSVAAEVPFDIAVYRRRGRANLVAGARVTSGAAFSGRVLGFSTVASLGTGLFELTLSNPIDIGDNISLVTIDGGTDGSATVQQTDDDTILVDTFSVAAAAANRAFQIAVVRHGVGLGDRP